MKKGIIIVAIFLIATMVNAQTKGSMTISVTTSTVPLGVATSSPPQGFRGGHGGSRTWAPENCLAIWIEDNTGKFVKTITVNAARYQIYLTSWKNSTSAAGSTFNKVDAVTGATNRNHGTRNCTWDGTDFNGKVVADGTYKVCIEFTETNSTGYYTSYTITKGKSIDIQTPADKPGFSAITLKWSPASAVITKN